MGKKITKELAHGTVMKMSLLATAIRLHPRKLNGSIINNSLGKCLELGTEIVRSYVDNEETILEALIDEFNTRYKNLMSILQGEV
jgi:hypothetical protein